jgi:hydrogenase expression/formation protein HypD
MSEEPFERLHARISERISEPSVGPVSFMEVCGTHTMAIGRFGIRGRLPRELRLVSGPGCPVCVTSAADVDRAIALARTPGVTLLTFGDLVRVPGSRESLGKARAEGADLRVLYSPADALAIAAADPRRLFVFAGIGFETTSPAFAATVLRAREAGLRNLLVLPLFKLVPPAMEALAASEGFRIDGFLCPGHVAAILGAAPFRPLASRFGLPCVIAGFEAGDILDAVLMLLEQRASGRAEVEIQYRRAVPEAGNPLALRLQDRVFEPVDARWRGIGLLRGTGLAFRPEFLGFDALSRIPVEVGEVPDLPPGCACGEVMKGLKDPAECGFFGVACSPAHPLGPCMVSSEGACAAWHRYGGAGRGEGARP